MGVLPESEPQPEIAGQKLGFDARVPNNGYRWWYLDAFSDDGKAALTIIVFIGSVFSPYYFSARRRSKGNPENFCSVNAILYGPDRRRWALTERGAGDLQRGQDRIVIGPSRVDQKDESRFVFQINEMCNPWPSRIKGQIELSVPALGQKSFALDPGGLHRWWPAAPAGRVTVTMQRPDISWEGAAYLDCNAGVVPLEQTFRNWHWQRSAAEAGGGHIHYDATLLNGDRRFLGLGYGPDMSCSELSNPGEDTAMVATPLWRAQRRCRTVTGQARVKQTLEESPFYARSVVELDTGLGPRKVMHESLHLDRFTRPWMQMMLPVRMPRRPLHRP